MHQSNSRSQYSSITSLGIVLRIEKYCSWGVGRRGGCSTLVSNVILPNVSSDINPPTLIIGSYGVLSLHR